GGHRRRPLVAQAHAERLRRHVVYQPLPVVWLAKKVVARDRLPRRALLLAGARQRPANRRLALVVEQEGVRFVEEDERNRRVAKAGPDLVAQLLPQVDNLGGPRLFLGAQS